jgi:DNA invertase Pin-like site-specific DNA recombinase
MPPKKEIMAGYIRESDVNLADSTTIESAAHAVREYGARQGYIYPTHLEFKEAVSAYQIPYFQRKRLMDMLEAAKRREFTVLVITEVRALSRRGAAEVLLIYQALIDEGVRLETIHEKFSDDPMGELALTWKATFARLEREQSWLRMERGKLSRIEIGKAPSACSKPPYGYLLIDTEREVKGAYVFNHEIIHIDRNGRQWSEYKVVAFIFDLLCEGESFHGIARILNELGIPPRSKAKTSEPHWRATAIRNLVNNPIYTGEVWAHRYTKITQNGKKITHERPREEWIKLPDAPAIVDSETFAKVQFNIAANKNESLRNNHHPTSELGLVRNGYCRCGVCARTMILEYPAPAAQLKNTKPAYRCQQRAGKNQGIAHNHNTYIRLDLVDDSVKEKIKETLQDVSWVRAKVAELRKKTKPIVDPVEVHTTIAKLQTEIDNLFDLARYATSDKTRERLGLAMQDLERQQRETEGLLYDIADDEEEKAILEKEIVRFEKWVDEVRPSLLSPEYTPSYEELRFAVRILGIVVTVYPRQGDWPFRCQVKVTAPEILAGVVPDCKPSQPSASSPVSSRLFGPRVAR